MASLREGIKNIRGAFSRTGPTLDHTVLDEEVGAADDDFSQEKEVTHQTTKTPLVSRRRLFQLGGAALLGGASTAVVGNLVHEQRLPTEIQQNSREVFREHGILEYLPLYLQLKGYLAQFDDEGGVPDHCNLEKGSFLEVLLNLGDELMKGEKNPVVLDSFLRKVPSQFAETINGHRFNVSSFKNFAPVSFLEGLRKGDAANEIRLKTIEERVLENISLSPSLSENEKSLIMNALENFAQSFPVLAVALRELGEVRVVPDLQSSEHQKPFVKESLFSETLAEAFVGHLVWRGASLHSMNQMIHELLEMSLEALLQVWHRPSMRQFITRDELIQMAQLFVLDQGFASPEIPEKEAITKENFMSQARPLILDSFSLPMKTLLMSQFTWGELDSLRMQQVFRFQSYDDVYAPYIQETIWEMMNTCGFECLGAITGTFFSNSYDVYLSPDKKKILFIETKSEYYRDTSHTIALNIEPDTNVDLDAVMMEMVRKGPLEEIGFEALSRDEEILELRTDFLAPISNMPEDRFVLQNEKALFIPKEMTPDEQETMRNTVNGSIGMPLVTAGLRDEVSISGFSTRDYFPPIMQEFEYRKIHLHDLPVRLSLSDEGNVVMQYERENGIWEELSLQPENNTKTVEMLKIILKDLEPGQTWWASLKKAYLTASGQFKCSISLSQTNHDRRSVSETQLELYFDVDLDSLEGFPP